jgi:ubiquinone/menaquinone biosynthesis C-methylase UbiE
MEKDAKDLRICPVESAGALDGKWRRILQNPVKILKPYIRSNMTVLDLGSGPGFFTIEIARMLNGTGTVVAADIQKGMLDIIKRKLTGTGLESNVELHLCDASNMLPDKIFDFVLAFYSVHEIPGHERLFRELREHLGLEGLLYICEPAFHVTRKEFEKLIGTMEKAGFQVVERPNNLFSHTLVARPLL